jgi:hypothetical protein
MDKHYALQAKEQIDATLNELIKDKEPLYSTLEIIVGSNNKIRYKYYFNVNLKNGDAYTQIIQEPTLEYVIKVLVLRAEQILDGHQI